jgi:hypothetical protein
VLIRETLYGKNMLQLADTSIRLYRKKNGLVSVRLHSYLMIYAKKQGFSLPAYLNQFDCSLTFESGECVLLDDYSYTVNCFYKMGHMIHELWASGTMELETMTTTAGLLRIEYRIFSHPGQGEADVFERVVPVLPRGPYRQR